MDEPFDVGADTGTPMEDKDYQVPFRFTGQLNKLTLTIDRPKLTPADEKWLMKAQRNNKVSEYMVMRLYWLKDTPPSILPPGGGSWNPPGVVRIN